MTLRNQIKKTSNRRLKRLIEDLRPGLVMQWVGEGALTVPVAGVGARDGLLYGYPVQGEPNKIITHGLAFVKLSNE